MVHSVKLSAAIALSLCLVANAMPAWYNCNPATCLPPKCMCASNSAPGGLAPADTPQFILLTHDDAVNALSDKLMRSLSDKHTNPNGCNMPVTWYVLEQGTDCPTAKRLWEQNHEMALHTVNHVALYASFNGNLEQEMMGVRTFLNKTCGIPLTDLVGYRDPYLVHNPATRKMQAKNGILYDSSMIQVFLNSSETETKPGMRIWPFTMDAGIPINCNWNYPDGQCNGTTERYPGLWEVPLWELQNANADHLYSMDVGTNPPGDIYKVLEENFNMNYLNNRAPFGIFLHSTWFDAAGVNAGIMNKFLEWAMAQPNVWAITTKDLIRWMQAPVPASQMAQWLKCNPVDMTVADGVVKCQLYTIQEGDSSYSVATKFAVTMEDMLSINPELGTGASLNVGQQVRIPTWDDSCVGDAIKPVTAPGQVAVTPATQDPAATTTTTTTPSIPTDTFAFDPVNPSSGVNITMTLAGRPQLAFQTDLKTPFTMELARALGVKKELVSMMSVSPLNSLAGRRRLSQATRDLPIVTAVLRVGSPDPDGLLANVTKVLPMGGSFDSDILPNYQLKMTAAPQVTPFRNFQAYDPNAPGTTTPGTTGTTGTTTKPTAAPSKANDDGGLSVGAIVGIAVGGAVLLILLIVGTIFLVRRRKERIPEGSPMASTSSDGKFYSEKSALHDDMDGQSV